MNKQEFLSILQVQLKGIPTSELNEILADYNEHFEIGMASERSESEIAASLGNPKTIAKELKANFMVNQAKDSLTVNSFFQAFMATLGLGFFNLVFILGPFIGVFSVIVSLIIASASIAISGVAMMIMAFISPIQPVVLIFLGIAMGCLGVILTILSYNGCVWFLKLTVKYLQANINIISNRREKRENN
jgi:uncharacterized membrane protein